MAKYYVVHAWYLRKQQATFHVDAPSKREAARMVRDRVEGVGLYDEPDSFDHGPLHITSVEAAERWEPED